MPSTTIRALWPKTKMPKTACKDTVITASFRYILQVMRSFAAFLLGVVIGAVGMLFLPELTPRREQLNDELKKQINVLQGQVHDLGEQLKKVTVPKSDDDHPKQASPRPSPP